MTADEAEVEAEAEVEDYVVLVELTHDNGVVVREVTAESSADALDEVLGELFGEDYEPGSGHHRHTRETVVVRGEIC